MRIKETDRITDDGKVYVKIDPEPNAKALTINLAEDFVVEQRKKPIHSCLHSEDNNDYWCFRNKILFIEDYEGIPDEEIILRIKHFIYQKEVELERIKQEVQAFESRGKF